MLETATAGATRYDPLLRGALRSSVRAAVRRAASATHVAPERDGEAHHLRVAFLDRAGRLAGVDPNDVAAVAAAYGAASRGYPRQGKTFWPVTASLLFAILLAGITTVALFFRPTMEERFRKTPLATALGEPLTSYVVAIAKQQTPTGLARLQKNRDAILAADVRKQIGDGDRLCGDGNPARGHGSPGRGRRPCARRATRSPAQATWYCLRELTGATHIQRLG